MTEQTAAPENTQEGSSSQATALEAPASEAVVESGTPKPAETTEAEDTSTSLLDGGEPESSEGETSETEDGGDGDTQPEGAPESYEEFRVPDGAEAFDEGVIATFGEAAKAANLTQDQAQAFLDQMAPAIAQRQKSARESMVAEWREAAQNDEEFGGDRFKENLGIANKGFTQFCSPEMQKLAKETGLASNPEFIRTMFRVGKAISEDTFVRGETGKRQSSAFKGDVFADPEAARVIYGKKS